MIILTPDEIEEEWEYRVAERLSILLGEQKGEPTEAMIRLARKEADEWKADFLKRLTKIERNF